MVNSKNFRLEEQFNYKEYNCYIGFSIYGYRIAGVEIPVNNETNYYELLSKIENSCICDDCYYLDEKNMIILETYLGHSKYRYNIEEYKEIWGSDCDQESLKNMETTNNDNLNRKIGTKDLARKSCISIVKKFEHFMQKLFIMGDNYDF